MPQAAVLAAMVRLHAAKAYSFTSERGGVHHARGEALRKTAQSQSPPGSLSSSPLPFPSPHACLQAWQAFVL